MDAQLQVALVLVSVLGGGAVGFLTAHFTRRGSFADARRLQSRDRAIHELAIARALDFELATNAASANSRVEGGGLALLLRSAYEAARQLELPTEVEALIGLAYEEAELYNSMVLMYRTAVLTDIPTAANVRDAMRPADAKKAFEDAIAAFRRHKILDKLKTALET